MTRARQRRTHKGRKRDGVPHKGRDTSEDRGAVAAVGVVVGRHVGGIMYVGG